MDTTTEKICKYCGYIIEAPKKKVFCSIRCAQDETMMNHLIRKKKRLQAEAVAPEPIVKPVDPTATVLPKE